MGGRAPTEILMLKKAGLNNSLRLGAGGHESLRHQRIQLNSTINTPSTSKRPLLVETSVNFMNHPFHQTVPASVACNSSSKRSAQNLPIN
jgi:hypothetical protein